MLLLSAAAARQVAAGGPEWPAVASPEAWREVFAYCQEVSAEFGEDGEAVAVRRPAASFATARPLPAFDPAAEAAGRASGGDETRAAAFLAWLEGEYSEPGETVMVEGTDEGGVYVLSEHGAVARCLKRYDMAARRAECITPPDNPRELVGPVFLFSPDGGTRLGGLVWNSPEGTRTEWRDPAMAALQARLEEAFPKAGFDWFGPGPERWIVRVRWAERPPAWLFADAAEGTWRVVAECPVAVSPTVRTVFRFTASDGAAVTGVFTRPDAPGPFPLVVFPHGGPGAVSTTDFDERVWALADAGFAVFQPNYRGSKGFGKRFRLDGWGGDGIRRGWLDVREGVAALFADPEARLDGRPPVLLGGSWGGTVALAQLALFSGDYAGAVSFFGAFDLPALLREAWTRAGEEALPAEAERTRRSLRRQFGDPGNDADMAALAAVSPIHGLDAIRAPVILFHNRGDRVIPFAQSERMAVVMESRNMPFLFRAAEGDHGWAPAEEADLYAALAEVFRGWMEQ
ncbi:MAG: prolyl oligopeptidase family serine peptidase [Kiritimatiellae bacterium]|nr:prolyl oligopeptidase family serine peptidase [Kiritimatiellia bacterium]